MMKSIKAGLMVFALVLASAFVVGGLDLKLSDYPLLFFEDNEFNAIMVVGDSAASSDVIGSIDIAISLQYSINEEMKIGAAKLASEVEDITQYNVIIIGGPCANAAAAQIMGYPEDCLEGFNAGKAIIKIYENGEKLALLVAGGAALDTRRACRVLANYMDYIDYFGGTEVEVYGTSFSDIIVESKG